MIPKLSPRRRQPDADDGLHLVLLPGLDGTGQLFLPLLEILPAWIHPHVITYPSERMLDYDQLTAFVMERLPGAGRIVLLGESFSGPVAVKVAATAPERLVGMILVATFVTSPLAPIVSGLARMMARPALLAKTPPRFLLRWWLLGKDAPESLIRLVHDALAMVAAQVKAGRIVELLRVDVREELRMAQVPVLYITATNDRVVSRRCGREITRDAQEVTVKHVDGPHLVLQCAPESALRRIVSFITGLAD